MARSPKKGRRQLKPPSPPLAAPGVRYPFVAIVGRPNVGKSTLFNRLVGQRVAITEPTAGTTRDRIAALVELPDGRKIEVCDMGGLGGTGDAHDADVNRQIDLAMEYADAILFLVDARDGLVPLDQKIAQRVKRLGKPTLLIANKADTRDLEVTAGEFYALGFPGELLCTSAREGFGRWDVLDALAKLLPAAEGAPAPAGPPADDGRGGRGPLRLAIVGRRNVGKSTLVNRLVGDERVIVSEKPGTTRDAVDVLCQVGGRDVVLIDTAGLRKRGKFDDHIEIISHGRAVEAVRRADAVLLVLDALEKVAAVDKKLAQTVEEEHKACVVVANKWDLVEQGMTLEQFAEYVHTQLPGLDHCPVVSISAKEGDHATAPVQVAFELDRQARVRTGTAPLNRALGRALERRRPKPRHGKMGKVYFGTQVAVNPVTVLLFVNEPSLFERAWLRYLKNELRKQLPWPEVPVKIVLRSRLSLAKKGGGIARRLEHMGGLAEQAHWLEDDPNSNVRDVAALLDEEEVAAVLLRALGPRGDDGEGADEDEGGEGDVVTADELARAGAGGRRSTRATDDDDADDDDGDDDDADDDDADDDDADYDDADGDDSDDDDADDGDADDDDADGDDADDDDADDDDADGDDADDDDA